MTHRLQFRRDSIETGGVINVQKRKTGRFRGILLSTQYQIWVLILHPKINETIRYCIFRTVSSYSFQNCNYPVACTKIGGNISEDARDIVKFGADHRNSEISRDQQNSTPPRHCGTCLTKQATVVATSATGVQRQKRITAPKSIVTSSKKQNCLTKDGEVIPQHPVPDSNGSSNLAAASSNPNPRLRRKKGGKQVLPSMLQRGENSLQLRKFKSKSTKSKDAKRWRENSRTTFNQPSNA